MRLGLVLGSGRSRLMEQSKAFSLPPFAPFPLRGPSAGTAALGVRKGRCAASLTTKGRDPLDMLSIPHMFGLPVPGEAGYIDLSFFESTRRCPDEAAQSRG